MIRPTGKMYKPIEVANILGISKRQVLNYIVNGYKGVYLKATLFGSRYYIRDYDLSEFMDILYEMSMFGRYFGTL